LVCALAKEEIVWVLVLVRVIRKSIVPVGPETYESGAKLQVKVSS
jgi:hypothetical protein